VGARALKGVGARSEDSVGGGQVGSRISQSRIPAILMLVLLGFP